MQLGVAIRNLQLCIYKYVIKTTDYYNSIQKNEQIITPPQVPSH